MCVCVCVLHRFYHPQSSEGGCHMERQELGRIYLNIIFSDTSQMIRHFITRMLQVFIGIKNEFQIYFQICYFLYIQHEPPSILPTISP